MAMEQYFQEAVAHHEVDGDGSPPQKWKPVSVAATATATASDNVNGCFDCNICLDNAQDPVVTLCGHLYCWPCIYKWLHFQSASTASEQKQQQCPVCKANISHTTLVPLYGRGQSSPQTEPEGKGPFPGLYIPRRPPACAADAPITTTSPPNQQYHRNPYQSQAQQYYPQYYNNYPEGEVGMGATTSTTSVFHPMVGMFGEMVYARVFGNSEASLYGYPNSYHLIGSSSPRVRRQEMQAEKSLSRISFFLFCCFVLCLLLF